MFGSSMAAALSAAGIETAKGRKEMGKMKYICDFKEGDRLSDIYLIKNVQNLSTKNGKSYMNVVLQDKTGTVDAKIWDPNDAGIGDFEKLDYVDIVGDVTVFNGNLQVNIKRARKCAEGEYDTAQYLPMSRFDIDKMYNSLQNSIEGIENRYLHSLLVEIFVKDESFVKLFKSASAAKSVHHAFYGGLLEHTLYVTKMSEFLASTYTYLNHDLLVTAAMCHDIGKVREISQFPENDYTDDGQLLGHIVMGSEMVSAYSMRVEGFPLKLLTELKHCILAHHGELEYGSPKKPALAEALALNFADNTDAKLETMREALDVKSNEEWLGFNRFLDSNIRKTQG